MLEGFQEALSHTNTLEVSCYSLIIVLLPVLESMEGKKHPSYCCNSMKVYKQNHRSTALDYREAQTQIILPPETTWMRYNYIYLYNISILYYIDDTMGHKKNRNDPRHGILCVIEYSINKKPSQSFQENAITWTTRCLNVRGSSKNIKYNFSIYTQPIL